MGSDALHLTGAPKGPGTLSLGRGEVAGLSQQVRWGTPQRVLCASGGPGAVILLVTPVRHFFSSAEMTGASAVGAVLGHGNVGKER